MADLRPLIEKLRTQRLDPLGKALGATADGLPPARRIIALPSRALAGIPIEALLAADDIRSVSYAPSATVFKYLRDQPRPDRHAGLLALGDPVYERPDSSSEPKAARSRPAGQRGGRGSNAAAHDLKPGDVLLAYNGRAEQKEDLKIIAEGDKPIVIDIWRDGRYSPARAGSRSARRNARRPAGTGGRRRQPSDRQGARGVAVGRRGLRPPAGSATRSRCSSGSSNPTTGPAGS